MVALELRSGFYRPAEEGISKRRLRERSSAGEKAKLATAACPRGRPARWRARMAWRAREKTEGRRRGGGRGRARRVESVGGWGGQHQGRRRPAASGGAPVSSEKKEEQWRQGWFCDFQNFRGLTVK
jgi:hypothetical protein